MALTIQDATIITVEGFEAQIGKSSEFPTDPSTLHTPKVGNVMIQLSSVTSIYVKRWLHTYIVSVYCSAFGGIRDITGFSRFFHRLTYLFTTDEHLVASSITLTGLVAFRVALLGGTLPRFSEHDNPASHHPRLLTRALTYGYLAAMNAGVVLWPRVLSYDWQAGSVPLVHSLLDVRNLSTVILVVVLVQLVRRTVHKSFQLLFSCTAEEVGMRSDFGKSVDQPDVHHTTYNNNNNSASHDRASGSPTMAEQRHLDDSADKGCDSVVEKSADGGSPLLLTSAALVILPWLPASNLLVTVGFVLAERVLYIPSMGFCLLFVEGLRRLLFHLQDITAMSTTASPVRNSIIQQQRSGRRNTWNRKQKFVLVALLILLCLGTVRTVRRNRVWMTRETLFESGVREMPMNCKMHYNYGNLQRDLGRSGQAERHYKIALELCPTHASAHNNLGTVLTSTAEAEKHFRKAININLHHAGAHYNLAMLYRRRGQVEVARGLLERSLALDASLAEAASSLAELEGQRGRTNEAEKLHRRAIELNGRSAPIRNNYGTFLHHQGRLQEASEQYMEAIALEPTNTIAMVNAAETMKKLQVDQEAEDLYRRALSLNAEDVSVMDQLAVLYAKAERFREAEELFTQILKKHPHHRESQLHYSQMLLSQGDASTSERILFEALEQSKGLPWRDGLRQMALLYSYTNRSADAAEWIRKAIQLCPPDAGRECAPLYTDYGDILKDLSHLNRSAECYMEAIRMQPDLAHAHINLGVIRHLQGDYSTAFDHYTVAYALEPWNTLVVENMNKLRRRILKTFRQHRTTIDAAFEVS
ncbi:transmembrane and TPR repeat-containing protein 1-like [Varroa jacobsoni]|uniref:transmembrane and TPR repeat-containing protein 1-like n=1 Tax=Varroa jacobsoni TaxID=62625 RepID=UPI000BF76DF1|nr:transmembrane and TPR repeat-containing protein 1-like [Varroa jacobsoni]